MRAFHEHSDRINTDLTFINLQKAHITKSCMLLSSAEIFEASSTKSVDPDQTAPVVAVRSGSTQFAYIHMLTNKQTFSDAVILLKLGCYGG